MTDAARTRWRVLIVSLARTGSENPVRLFIEFLTAARKAEQPLGQVFEFKLIKPTSHIQVPYGAVRTQTDSLGYPYALENMLNPTSAIGTNVDTRW